MKLALAVVASLLIAAVLRLPADGSSRGSAVAAASDSRAPVVVELFTSEGCSSCPPADALLSELENKQPIAGAQIIAIEEHVDYWNHLGWADPFSSPEWTARQQEYGSAFGQDGDYTPEMVVGGSRPFVGSRADLAVKAIQEARRVPAVDVKLTRSSAGDPNEPHFAVSVGKFATVSPGDSVEVWLAVTESGLASQVAAGENAGRNVRHASVLRSLRRIGKADPQAEAAAAAFQGDAAVKLKAEWKRENLTAVVLVQERRSKHILGAASLKIAS